MSPNQNSTEKIDTKLIRSGRSDQPDSLAPAIFASTTHVMETLEEGKRKSRDLTERRFYSRHSNPSVGAFEEAIAELEGAEAARAFSSGMGAISSVVLSLCQTGDHIVVSRQLYGASFLFFSWIGSRLGIEVSFVDGTSPGAFRQAVVPGKTTLVFVETPSNPRITLVDLEEVCALEGPIVVVDSTAAPPVIQRPLDFGADLSLHSATKFIAGHNDAILGVVSGSEELMEWVRGYAVLHGANASPFDATNALRGLRTLGVRLARQCETALSLAQMLEEHPAIEKVWYPDLTSHSQHDLARRQMKMAGGLLAFELKTGDTATGAKFMDSLKIAQNAPSFGGPETLATHPASTTHAGLLPEELAEAGISETTIRVSVGLEHPADILRDFRGALEEI